MKQREVQDEDNTRWTCVEALSGIEGAAAEAVEEKTAGNAKVDVVCTPSGGARTRRLQLDSGWEATLSDAELLDRIKSAPETQAGTG